MLRKKNKKQITVDEFLQFRPQRKEFEWYTSEDDLVRIKVPKFKSNFGRSFCKLIHRDDTFTANLDRLGSLVWKHCDGNYSIKQMLEILQKEFLKEENIDQRLFLFIRQMHSLGYISY